MSHALSTQSSPSVTSPTGWKTTWMASAGAALTLLPGHHQHGGWCGGAGKVQLRVVVLLFVQTGAEQPSLSRLFPALPECAAAPAYAAGPAASTTPTHTVYC